MYGRRARVVLAVGACLMALTACSKVTPTSPLGVAGEPAVVPAASATDGAEGEIRSLVLAGGCFWCMEPPFDELPGVLSTTSGYSGGNTVDPTYEEVTYGKTGHYEVVRVTYDSTQVELSTLLATYWRNIDPFDPTGQFCDKGASYRSAIFVANDAEQKLAQASLAKIQERFDASVVTRIEPLGPFYPAEDYHQDYYQKNPLRYKFYRTGCRRDARLRELWGAAPKES